MIGHRLIIKRRIPKGREQLLALFAGAFVIVGLVMVAQLKATLSAKALTSVGADLADIHGRLNNAGAVGATGASPAPTTPTADVADSTETVTPADTAVEKFKKLLQEVPVTP